MIQRVIPGCGLTAFNIWSLTYEWWLIYVQIAQAAIESKPAGPDVRRGHRG